MRNFFRSGILLVALLLSCSGGDRPSDGILNIEKIRAGEGARFYQLSSADTTGGNNDRINIHPGQTATLAEIEGPGLISRIWITIDSRDPHFLRRILLRMYWDGEAEPSVEVPVGDFFGSAFMYRHHTPELIGMSSGGYYCYFPMPFGKRARIEVVNETGEEIYAFYYQIGVYRLEEPLPAGTAYFHARWRRDIRTETPGNYVALDAEGKGRFVGLHFNGQSYDRDLFYLEGDEMIYVDGEEAPSVHGTGLEDYFNSGWYFKDGTFDAAYHGLVLMDTLGRVTAYRHHWPDPIPFSKSLRVTLEHGHGNEEAVDFSTTAFWYQTEPHKPFAPMPEAGLRIPLQRPVPNGALEAEALELVGAKGLVEDMSQFGSDWSGAAHLAVDLADQESFRLRISDAPEKAYDLALYLTRGPQYGKVRIQANGGAEALFDGFAEAIGPAEPVLLKGVIPEDGAIELAFTLEKEGTLPGIGRAGVDAVLLTPKRTYIPEWYMIGPFPNPRESDDLRFGLDSIYPPERETDLSATYQGAEGQEVSWQRFSGKEGGYAMRLTRQFEPYEFIVSYFLTYVYSPEAQQVPLLIGSDDGAKVFLNDRELYRFLAVRIAAPDQDTVELSLKPGWNKLMIKAENNFGGYAFYARVLDLKNNLKFDIDGPAR